MPDDDRPTAGGGNGDAAKIENVLARYVEKLNAGEKISPWEIERDHPEFASELIDQLKIFQDGVLGSEEPVVLGTIGDYKLLKHIGRGGMGVVYEAWQNSMDRRVALKVMPKAIAVDTRAVARFIQEAQLAGKLNHPNIVHVHGMGVEQQVPYYAMDFVEGDTLAQIVANLKEAEPETETVFGKKDRSGYFERIAEAFADVADGLQHAHSKKVIHRDIKPSNLILDREGRLRILDFGLARLEGQESLTVSGDFLGTPQYMSPEQARRKKIPVDHRTDVYSLGATLYEMLTLEPPFRGKDHADTLSQIIERDPVEPMKLNPRVPKDLETIVLKCLRKDAGDRYGTADAMGQDLRRFVRGDAVEARPEARWGKATRWVRRHQALLTTVASFIILALVGLSAALFVTARAYDKAVDERKARECELYISDMRLAVTDWESGSFAGFEERLDRHRPKPGQTDLCGWEWRYLESLRHVPVRTIEVDQGGALAVAWNPKGETIAAGGDAGFVSIFRVADGERTHHLKVSDSSARAVAWSPDGSMVIGVAHDGTVRCWALPGAQEAFVVLPEKELPPGAELRSARWSPNGRWLATAEGDITVKIRDGRTGNLLKLIPATETDCVTSVEWSPDGSQLAASFRSPTFVVVWETGTWKELRRGSPNPGYMYYVDWSPDGARLAMCVGGGMVHLWNATTLEPQPSHMAHTALVLGGDWSPDGNSFVSAGGEGLVKIWKPNLKDEPPTIFRGHRYSVWSVAWSPDGSRIASASTDGTLKIWDPDHPGSARELRGANAADWSRDGKRLAVWSPGEKCITMLETATWEVIARVPHEGWVTSLSFSPDARRLLSVGPGDRLAVHDLLQGVELISVKDRLGGPSRFGFCAAWSPDGHWIASGGPDGIPRIWDPSTLTIVQKLTAHKRPLGAVVWSTDGARLATTSIDLSLKIFESGTWRQLHDLYRRRAVGLRNKEYATSQSAIAWSPDGSKIAASVTFVPNSFVVLDARTGDEVFKDAGHVPGLVSVAWSPDGLRIATAGYDRVVSIWDAERFVQIAQLRDEAEIVSTLSWSPDGRWLLSATGESIKVRDGGQKMEVK
ncbi:MAG: protein kinase [Planctomycetes bacterium]|nr:protein kinase [Planctomycetota bacterium]